METAPFAGQKQAPAKGGGFVIKVGNIYIEKSE